MLTMELDPNAAMLPTQAKRNLIFLQETPFPLPYQWCEVVYDNFQVPAMPRLATAKINPSWLEPGDVNINRRGEQDGSQEFVQLL